MKCAVSLKASKSLLKKVKQKLNNEKLSDEETWENQIKYQLLKTYNQALKSTNSIYILRI